MNKCKLITFLSVLTASINSNPNIKKTSDSIPKEIQRRWKLISIFQDTGIVVREFHKKMPFMTIDCQKHQIHGFAGCNSFSGAFILITDNIKMHSVNATQMGCMMKGANIFFTQFSKANRFQVSEDSLKLYVQDKIVLSFFKDKQ